jgi:uncharacterized membrane protein YfcA
VEIHYRQAVEMIFWFLAYLVLGMASGFLAGLFGAGGGAVLVPLLTMMFAAQSFPHEHVLHLALGTSMATIVFTSISSLRAHHQHDAVLWPIVRMITPGIVAGTLLGAQLASRVPTRPLALFFSAFVAYVAIQMMLNIKPKASRELPGRLGMMATGAGIGGISSLVAIGGGSLSVPFMTWCNIRIQHAIGTSAAIGLPIALSGTVGYMIAGYATAGLPEGSFGYVYLPALAGTVISSVLTAPFGAKLAHRLPIATTKKSFALVLILVSAKMLQGLFSG